MSLKNLEKHQNINKRDWDNSHKTLSLKQQQAEKKKQLQKRKDFPYKKNEKLDRNKFIWSNVYKKYIPVNEWTDEMEEKENELDYLINHK